MGSNEAYRRYTEQRTIVERLTGQLNLLRQTDSTDADKLKEQLATAIDELDQRESDLHQACPRWQELVAPQAGKSPLDDIASKLLPGTLLLAYLFHDDSLLAWAVTIEGLAGRTSVKTFQGEKFIASTFAYRVKTWREQVSKNEEDAQLSTALAQVLLEPFDCLIAQTEHLVIVPYAELNMLPFQALPWCDHQPLGRQEPTLGWQKSVSYLPAASMLQHFRPLDQTASDALVVGDPEKMIPPGKSEPVPPLPAARIGARLVADLYNVQPLIGPEATELAVRDQIDHGPRVIHLATHGYLQEDAPLASCVALADGEALSVDELMGLDLKADIVVLSACDTGRGKLQGSELIGLARGVLYTGARAVIVSLWPVDDIPTTILMQLLHHIKLRTNKPFAQALWQAEYQLRQITAPKLHKFCAVATKLVGTDPLEQAEFLRYLSDQLAAYQDFGSVPHIRV